MGKFSNPVGEVIAPLRWRCGREVAGTGSGSRKNFPNSAPAGPCVSTRHVMRHVIWRVDAAVTRGGDCVTGPVVVSDRAVLADPIIRWSPEAPRTRCRRPRSRRCKQVPFEASVDGSGSALTGTSWPATASGASPAASTTRRSHRGREPQSHIPDIITTASQQRHIRRPRLSHRSTTVILRTSGMVV